MINTFPSWLTGFYFKIFDEYETLLLDEEETNPENVRFVDSLGITVGTKILIYDKDYFVKNFEIYSDMNLTEDGLRKSNEFYFDLHIIVSETND